MTLESQSEARNDSTARCETCKFAFSETGTDLRSTIYCRRFPPAATMFQGPRGQVMNISSFPTVTSQAWCGEYQTKQVLQ